MKISKEEKNIIEQFIVPFFHFQKRFPLMPGKNEENIEAKILGINNEDLKSARIKAQNNAKKAALELLKEEKIIEIIDNLPFDGNETIIGFGDSTTEDDQGWFQILKEILEITIDNAQFNFINAGISGNTTSEALRRVDRDILLHEPEWVIINLGTFDLQRLNIAQHRTLLPLSETWENLNSIQEVLTDNISNEIVWITPTPIISELIEAHPFYEFIIENKEVNQLLDIIAGKKGLIVDPQGKRMGKKPDPWNYISDGLNHSLIGHINTTRELLKGFASLKN